VQLAMLVQT
jgi:hypothetical protein